MKEMMHKNHLLNIFLLSIKNLFEPNIFKWVLYTTILTLIALSLLAFGIVYYVKDWLDTGIPFLGNFLMYGATLAAIWGSTILFVPTSTIIFSLFQDKIIDQIEEKYYPEVSKQLKIKFFNAFCRHKTFRLVNINKYNNFPTRFILGKFLLLASYKYFDYRLFNF